MNTGTPLDLTPFGAVLSAIGILYWLAALIALAAALYRPRRWFNKALLALLVIVVFGAIPGPSAWRAREARKNFEAAMARFEMRCKSAGETINQQVKDVDGVVWLKWRPLFLSKTQFALDDPSGHDCSGDECIKNLLRVTKGADLEPEDAKRHATGYVFVESMDPQDGRRYRYTGVIKSIAQRTPAEIEAYKKNTRGKDPGPDVYGFALDREPIASFTARYGVIWDDISTREDREQWIAGGSLKVIDLQTNAVVAERKGYLIDTGQGSTAGFRNPWGWAQSYAPRCPLIGIHTWAFSTRILVPTKSGE